jgi:copper chaperone CopZ
MVAEADSSSDNRGTGVARPGDSISGDSLLIVAIEGMHSHSCEEKVVKDLEAVGGVREAEVDFPSGQCSVIYDAREVTAHQLLETVQATGYRCGPHFLGDGPA